jgi:hypothetical protein
MLELEQRQQKLPKVFLLSGGHWSRICRWMGTVPAVGEAQNYRSLGCHPALTPDCQMYRYLFDTIKRQGAHYRPVPTSNKTIYQDLEQNRQISRFSYLIFLHSFFLLDTHCWSPRSS